MKLLEVANNGVRVLLSDEIRRREHFGFMLSHRGLNGEAVEVGTHLGIFAEHLLNRWGGRLHVVDPWQSDLPGYRDTLTGCDREADYRDAMNRLARFGERVTVHRLCSDVAARRIPDGSLNFVYIDANHQRAAVAQDMRLWWPKLARRGILAGHDWSGVWEAEVKPAVLEFAAEQRIGELLIVPGDVPRRFPPLGDAASWYFAKP